MARISGLSRPTVYAGVRELEERPDPGGRVRRRGGGPKRRTTSDPGLLAALDALVDPDTRGDPDSPLRWTCKSTRELAEALTAQGHPVSDDTVGRLLKQQGYTLQRTQKTLEGAQHPDRDGQFRYVNEQARSHLAAGQPVVSVDTKKKELVGRYANGGAEWQPVGEPERVLVHDFPDEELGKAIPYGVYDLGANAGWSAWDATTTRRRLRWRRCGAGGSRSAGLPIPRPNGCWLPRTRVGPTATGSGPGRPSWPGSRPRRACR
jgi:transposase